MARELIEETRDPRLGEAPEWEQKTDLVRRTVAQGASADELELLLYQARRSGLDPLARQIYFVKRRGKGVVQVGIDGLRLIADRTGLYAGNDDAVFEGRTPEGYPASAQATVYKLVGGQRCAFRATARWNEYYPGDDQGFMWRKMPHVMLAKCAEALALRKAFPAETSGLYVHEEMEQADATEPREEFSLEGRNLLEAVQRVLPARRGSPRAFGYAPERWPSDRSFAEPMTEKQGQMIAAKARERLVPAEDLGLMRRLVLEEYGVSDVLSKAAASLFIDWLMHAEEGALDDALTKAETLAGETHELDPFSPGAE